MPFDIPGLLLLIP